MKTYRSYSSQETKKLGVKLAKQVLGFSSGGGSAFGGRLKVVGRKRAIILALKGDLGSGKTTFVQGFLRGLGVKKRVNSPTFVLMKRFTLPASVKTSSGKHGSRFKNAYHLDCYRIKKPKELMDLGLREILADPENVVLVEWPEKIQRFLPRTTKRLAFGHGQNIKIRVIGVL
ncbi:MAG: UPF0079 ATP-binding protein [Parcubacteria group bacterium Gr01-1014_20]|nr:MAG: UPF0079 ATP-binding protein [Parcubacteria group bacterium Gr01-1014_20]